MRKIITLIFISLFLIPNFCLAKEFIPNGPLVSRTQNPIYLQSLGQTPERAYVNPQGIYSFWLDISYSNMYEFNQNAGNQVDFDMELARIAFLYNYGLGRDMEVELEVPFMHFNGGVLDAFIQDFHKLFGFPNGGRELVPNGQFTYRVRRNGNTIYEVNSLDIGLSDIIAGLKYNFIKESKKMPALAFRFRFKFPTGKSSSGTGDGNINYSLGLIAEKSISRWHFYLNIDYIIVSGVEALSELYYNQVFAWLTSVEFSVSQPISVIAQLQGSTPMLDNMGMSEWDGIPLDLVIGIKGTHKNFFWGNDFFWQWSFSEDVYPDGPSVDITTMLVLGVRFGG